MCVSCSLSRTYPTSLSQNWGLSPYPRLFPALGRVVQVSTSTYSMSLVVTCPIDMWTTHVPFLYGVLPHIANTCSQKVTLTSGVIRNARYRHARMHMSSISADVHCSDGLTCYPLPTLRWSMRVVDIGSASQGRAHDACVRR